MKIEASSIPMVTFQIIRPYTKRTCQQIDFNVALFCLGTYIGYFRILEHSKCLIPVPAVYVWTMKKVGYSHLESIR